VLREGQKYSKRVKLEKKGALLEELVRRKGREGFGKSTRQNERVKPTSEKMKGEKDRG